jgi:alanine racemase
MMLPEEPGRAPLPAVSSLGLIDQIGRTGQAPRSAWIEVDLGRLRRNLACVRAELPAGVGWLAVVKDNAYGHGMVEVARVALESGALGLGISTVEEGARLRREGLEAPILLMGERDADELPFCVEHGLQVCVGDPENVRRLNRLALEAGCCLPVHLKIDTGMSRFGMAWESAAALALEIRSMPGLVLAGVMSHFAMSDESDKTFALEQLRRFQRVLGELAVLGIKPGLRHLCNSGGFLDLPQAHYDLVRLGLLSVGVYPSKVCRRIPGIAPVMTVKARLVVMRSLQAGDVYGYGLRYRAPGPRRIGVIAVGYGDGYPRLRNAGEVLIRGRRVPLIGGVAMDATAMDLTDVSGAQVGDEVVLQGRQGAEEITARDIAAWGETVCYDVLAGWRSRLPRLYTA